jgi:tetratricopeptide (TPR) repeat protein
MVEQDITSETHAESERREKGRRLSNLLSLFLFLTALFVTGLVVLHFASPGFQTEAVANILRIVLILIGGWLPAIIYDSFTRERLPALFTEYKQNLRRLGYPASMRQYQEKFDEIYGRRPQTDRPWFISSPITVATVLGLVGWLLVFFPDGGDSLTPSPTPLAFGFLGAYVFSLGSLMRQYVSDDLQPRYYASLVNRYLSVFVLSWLVTLLVPAGNGEAGAPPDRYQLAAFAIGLFPSTGLRIAQRAGTTILGHFSDSFAEPHPLSRIDGINAYHEDRLLLEGIENMQSLCSAPIVDLMLKTRYPVEQLVDWIDQALLHLHARGRILDFQDSGLRTATDLLDAYDAPGLPAADLAQRRRELAQLLDAQEYKRLQKPDHKQPQEGLPQPSADPCAADAPDPICTLTQLAMIASALRLDPNLFNVRYWRDHEYEALPDDVERERTRADLKLMRGLPYEAIAGYTELLRKFPEYRTAYLYRGLAHYAAGEYLYAIQDYDQIIQHVKSRGEMTRHAYLERGRALDQLGEFEAAVENHRQALAELEKLPEQKFPEARLDLAFLLMTRLYQYDAAIESLEPVAHDEGSEFRAAALANLGLARYYRWQQQTALGQASDEELRRACDDLHQALRFKPDLVGAYLNLGLVLVELGQTAQALDILNEALRRLETIADAATTYQARLQRGDMHMQRRAYQAAADDYRAAAQLMPADASAYFKLGLALQQMGQWDAAAYALRDAARLYPRHALAQQTLGEVAVMRERFEEAETAFGRALALTREAEDEDGQARARLSLGRLYRRIAGRLTDARRELEQAVALAGEAGSDLLYTHASCELGVLHLESGAVDKAIPLLTTSVELFDVLGEARAGARAGLLLARAYLAGQNPSAATEALQEASQKLARVFEPQNDQDAALQAEIEAELARCQTDAP